MVLVKKQDRVFGDWIVLICLIFSAYVSLTSDKLNFYALYVVLPFSFVVSFFQARRLFINKYLKLLIALYIWELISFAWASYPEVSIREYQRILGAFLISYIIAVQAKRDNIIIGLYSVFFVLYIGAWIYASNQMLIVTDFEGSERLNDEKLNANTMAYYTTYVTYGVFVIAQIIKSKFWRKMFRILFFCMVPLSFFTALTTASRQIIIIQLPTILLLIWQRYLQHSKKQKKIFYVMLLLVAVIIIIPIVADTYQNSFLAQRAETSIEDDSRTFLLQESIKVGFQHFPLGVGAGNYLMYSKTRHFSHNSYAELFANVGIVGLVLYLMLIMSFISLQWNRYRRTNDKMFTSFLIFGIIYAIDQLFYVFYTDLWLISFFILVATHSDSYYKRHYSKKLMNE